MRQLNHRTLRGGATPDMLNDFKKLMSARFLFTFAVEMQGMLLGWRMYELTGSTLYLALIGLAEALPALSLALYAGYFVDRSRPLRVFFWVIVCSALSGGVMFCSQFPPLDFSNQTQVIMLFCASFLTGAARSFSQPSMYAIMPRLIERSELLKASARMTTAMQFARISGPALGGFIFGYTSMTFSAGVICAVLLCASAIVYFIKKQIEAPAPSENPGTKLQELFSGAKFVLHHPILFPALSLDMISVLFGGVSGLLPVFAKDILMVGAKGLGPLRSASALGAALTSAWMSRRDFRKRAGSLLFSAVTGFGVCMIVFGLSRNYYLSLAALGLSGAFDSISVIIRSTAVQLASPDALRGRISAVNSIFIGSSNELGEVESGIAAKLLGVVPSVLVGGGLCLLTVLVAAVLAPQLRRLDLGKLEAAHREPQ